MLPLKPTVLLLLCSWAADRMFDLIDNWITWNTGQQLLDMSLKMSPKGPNTVFWLQNNPDLIKCLTIYNVQYAEDFNHNLKLVIQSFLRVRRAKALCGKEGSRWLGTKNCWRNCFAYSLYLVNKCTFQCDSATSPSNNSHVVLAGLDCGQLC